MEGPRTREGRSRPLAGSPDHPPGKPLPGMGSTGMPPVIGWRPLWSKDRLQLVQVFTDLDTGSILATTVTRRRARWARWEPTTEVGPDPYDTCHRPNAPSPATGV